MPSDVQKHGFVPPTPQTPRLSRHLLALMLVLSLLVVIVAFQFVSHAKDQNLETASLAELEKMASADKNNPHVQFYLGQKQEQSGQLRLAMDTYWRALQLDMDNEPGWIAWARTTEAVLGATQACKVLDLWIQSSPNNTTAYLSLAHLYQRQSDYAHAYEIAEKGTKIDPKNSEFWQIMGGAAMLMGKPTEAETAFRRAVTLNPNEWRNYMGLSDALSRLSRQQEAIASAQDAVKHAPQEPHPHLILGTQLLQAAQTEKEIEAARAELLQVEKSVNSLPPLAQFQLALTLGDSYKRMSKWKEALPYYQRAEQLRPYDPAVPYSLIRVYRALGDTAALEKAEARYKTLDGYNQEIKVLTSRLETSPNDVQARLKLAQLYAKCEEFAQALQNYEALLVVAPEMQSARQERDRLLARAGRTGH